ncbi:MAG TPA: efflux RND transporter periplasmic adaptor subunit [Candidatus Sulfotelmatobacter sp.]|nr:efflux RND transporter periplasmic adaptor subunit [Candidatus Sulfotelmatobacter sp.]
MASNNNNSNGRPHSRRRATWLAAGVIAAVVLIPIFSRRAPLAVHVATVERGPIRSLVSTNGKIEPIENFEAHAPVATVVKRLLVKEGDHVRKGQLLLQLDDADIRSQAARAQAQITTANSDQTDVTTGGTHEEVLTLDALLVKARSERDAAQRSLDSFNRLQLEGAAAPGEVKQAEDRLRRSQADVTLLEQKQKDRYSPPEIAKVHAQSSEAEAAYAAAEDALGKSSVRAPFDGIVYSLPVKQGAYVQAGELLLQEADLSRVQVRIFIDEPDVGRLAPQQKVEVTWDALPGRIWNGLLSTIPSTVKLRVSRNVGEALCLLDNRDLRLLPNVNVGVNIITAEHSGALTLQREALRIDDSKPYVYEVVDGRLRRREVEISLQNLTRVEITSGLSENAVVALTADGSRPLSDGASVKVVP